MELHRTDLFVSSLLNNENPFITTNEVISWLEERNQSIRVNTKRIAFKDLINWHISSDGCLEHASGKFFSIKGINVKTNWGNINEWQQPIISQPEIGYLGIISKEINGVLYFLMQAKIEPGNVNNVQLSPTLQATKSNYTQVHKGVKPHYLEYFQKATKNQILLDQLQSEQGARFLKKRNRNIIIKVDEDIPVYEDFIWLTLGQIKILLRNNNLINMDTRTVISGIQFDGNLNITLPNEIRDNFINQSFESGMFMSAIEKEAMYNTFDDIINWMTSLKCKYELVVSPISLFETKDWVITDKEIHHIDNKFFKVIATEVEIENREVQKWTQPLVEPNQQGLVTFIVKKINGVFHFLVQAKLECGNFDILEMAPTVQCLTGSYADSKDLPFLSTVINAKPEQIKYDTLQSEEGGRFFREQNRNMIIEVDSSFPIEVPENYIWMTLNQLNTFLKFNNYLNIQARSIISAIKYNQN